MMTCIIMAIASDAEEIGNYQSDYSKPLKSIRKFSNSLKIDGLKIHLDFRMNQIHTALTSKWYFQGKIGKNICANFFKFNNNNVSLREVCKRILWLMVSKRKYIAKSYNTMNASWNQLCTMVKVQLQSVSVTETIIT